MHLPPSPRVSRWLLAADGLAVLAVVFQPLPHAAVGSVDVGYWLVQRLGLDVVISPAMIEFAWNVAMFVPITLLGSWAFRRLTWEQWAGIGLVLTSVIEYGQLLLLPGRSASVLDLASNTIGGVLGALIATRIPSSRRSHDAEDFAEDADPDPRPR